MSFRLDIVRADTTAGIKSEVKAVLSRKYADLFPSDRGAPVVIKPNLNSNMNALTGNTTDLRVLAAVIEFLKESGYSDITVGEGTNSGFYRSRISVISRLMIDRLASHYGVAVKDFNYAEPAFIDFEDGVKAGVARDCLDAAMLINMPKLKTHFEAGMSACLKNLMGCLVGQENKKKTHKSLAANILNINRAVRPHLHIVDAVISMEGLGPTRGTPVKTGAIFIGTDPYLIDMACAKFAAFDIRKVRTLEAAEKRGIVDESYYRYVEGLNFGDRSPFKPPKAGPIASFVHSPRRQKYFLAVRNTALFNYLCSTKAVGKMLYATGLRQDVFIDEEMDCRGLKLNRDKCDDCGKCREYCPIDMELPKDFDKLEGRCINCLYCFCVCPKRAVEFVGELGFMLEQLRQYDEIVRKM